MRTLFFPVAALVCCVSCGCVSDAARARDAAQAFLSAMTHGDSSAAQAVATLAARPNVATILKEGSSKGTGFTLGETQVKDDTAEVAVTLTDKESKATAAKVLLRREEKEWRVWGLRFQAESGAELTLDLEHPERLVGEALGLAFGELAKGLQGLSKDAEKTGRALGEAFGGFIKGLTEGVEKTAPKPPAGDVLAPPVVK